MPRIQAATVAEHRARQTAVLRDAACAILMESGAEALTFAALAKRSGLARPSLYEYFRSRDELIGWLGEQLVPPWMARLEAPLAAAGGPRERLLAFVDAQLGMAGDPLYLALHALVLADPRGPGGQRIAVAHRPLADQLAGLLSDLGFEEPARVGELLMSMLMTGCQHVVRGGSPDDVRRFVLAGLEALRHVGQVGT